MQKQNRRMPSLVDIIECGKDCMYESADSREMIRKKVAHLALRFSKGGELDWSRMLRSLKIELSCYSKIGMFMDKHSADVMRAFSSYGFAWHNPISHRFSVFYNDRMPPSEFWPTLQHEVGHVMLGHPLMSKTGKREEMQADFVSNCIDVIVFFRELMLHPEYQLIPVVLVIYKVSRQLTFMEKDETGKLCISPGGKELLDAIKSMARAAKRKAARAKKQAGSNSKNDAALEQVS